VASIIPASGAVSEYSVTVHGFEGLDFGEPISASVIDYALRYVPFCLTSRINAHWQNCCSHCQYMLDISGRSDWHKDIGVFTTMETNYVTNQLVELVAREELQNSYSSSLSNNFYERARLVAQQQFWILPLHYESVCSFLILFMI
jgi:hypothetical protein